MKFIYLMLITVILSSCFADKEVVKDEKVIKNPISIEEAEKIAEEETIKEIEEEISNIEIKDEVENNTNNEEISEAKVEKLDAKYVNWWGVDVDMSIKYTLDKNKLIKTISVSDSNSDMKVVWFNDAIQKELVWKSLDEASEFYISGSSLTSEAFSNALK